MIRALLTLVLFFFISYGNVDALIEYTKPTPTQIIDAAKACIDTGKSAIETKYTCPAGGFFQSVSKKVLSDEVYLCSAKMSLSFSAIDEAALKWMAELQKQRNPDFNVWSADIDATFSELNDTYLSVCKFTTWTTGNGTDDIPCTAKFNFFPESTCNTLARQKADAWRNAGYILAAKGIAKNAQNDKDTFVDEKKTKYSELVNKWNSYKRILANAVSKMTAYIRSPVK